MLFAFGFDLPAFARRMAEGTGDEGVDPAKDRLWFVLVITGDGKTELERLAQVAEESAADGEGNERLFDVQAGSRTLRAARHEDGAAITLPFVVGPHLVMVGASDFEATLERLLAHERTLAAGDVAHVTGSAGVWMNVRPVLAAVEDQIDAAPNGAVIGAVLDAAGVRAIDTLSCTVAPSGAHVVTTFGAELREDARGLLAAAAKPGGAPSFDLIPVQLPTWWTLRFDPDALYAAIGSLIEIGAEQNGQSFAQLEDQFAEFLHVRLYEDFIAHLGDQMFAVSQGADADAADPEAAEGACLGVLLDDPKAFGASLETALRSRGLHVSRKTEDYRGFAVQRFGFGGVTIYYTVSGRAFLVGVNDPGLRDLHAVLDEEKDRGEGKPRAALPKPIDERLEQVARGWIGVNVESTYDTLEQLRMAFYTGFYAAFDEGDAPFVFDDEEGDEDGQATSTNAFAILEEIDAAVDVTLELLERYDLETCVSVFRAERRRLQVQTIW
jgi:hypothetical protein